MHDQPSHGFLKNEFAIEDGIEAAIERLCRDGELGVRAPILYHTLDVALLLLAKVASCHWSCRGGNHVQENMVRRLVNYSLAVIRLAKLGFYDESLAIFRSLAEVTNLIELFTIDKRTMTEWLSLSPKERWKKFGPKSVRSQIGKSGNKPIVDGNSYNKLCVLGVHVSPESVKTSHQFDDSVFVGGQLSVPAFLLILNELAILIGAFLKVSGHFVGFKQTQVELLTKTGTELESGATSWLRFNKYEKTLATYKNAPSPKIDNDCRI